MPKCMFAVGSKPLLEHLIRIFGNAGSRRFVCVVRHCANAILDHFADGRSLGVEIEYVHQSGSNGNAYAVSQALPSLTGEPFFYCDADILFHHSLPLALRDRFAETESDGVLTFGFDPTIAPTHKSAAAFADALNSAGAALGVDLSEFVLMGMNILGPAVLDDLAATLPPPSNSEISVSTILLNTSRALRYEFSFYTGPWWHLAYPEDFDSLREKIDLLDLEPVVGGRTLVE